MTEAIYKDYGDGTHNVIVICEDKEKLRKVAEWCKQLGDKRVYFNDLSDLSGDSRAAATFAEKADADAFMAVCRGEKPTSRMKL